jgi:acetyl esterase/lipase
VESLAELHRTAGVAAAMVLYRIPPPRHPHPAALDDTIRAITALHASGELEEGRWILAGDSAGGGLALAAAQALRDSGGPMPAGLVLTAPWVDLEMATPQIEAAEKADPFLSRSALWWSARVYADGAALDDPRLSPINASMTGLPPVHLNVGTRDLFLPDVRRLRDALHDARVPVIHIEQEGAVHAYPQQITTPEAQWTIRDQIRWLRNVLPINELASTSASRSAPPAAPLN